MAIHHISILQGVQPDNTTRCWLEPYDAFATNDVWKHLVIRLANPPAGQAGGWYGLFEVPMGYVSAPAIKLYWTSTAITGNVCFRFTYRIVVGSNANSLDQISNTEQLVSATNAAPAAVHRKMDTTFTLSSFAFTAGAGGLVEYYCERFDNSAADTLAADVVIHGCAFEYADT